MMEHFLCLFVKKRQKKEKKTPQLTFEQILSKYFLKGSSETHIHSHILLIQSK